MWPSQRSCRYIWVSLCAVIKGLSSSFRVSGTGAGSRSADRAKARKRSLWKRDKLSAIELQSPSICFEVKVKFGSAAIITIRRIGFRTPGHRGPWLAYANTAPILSQCIIKRFNPSLCFHTNRARNIGAISRYSINGLRFFAQLGQSKLNHAPSKKARHPIAAEASVYKCKV